MNTTSSVTLLHKLITLQNLYSSFISNNHQALKEGKPLPEQLSINLFKLIYLINSNSLINKQFDVLNISQSFKAASTAAQKTSGTTSTTSFPYVPALSITDIIKIIIEVLGKDSIIIPQQSSSNKDKQLLRLSPQISLDFIKQNLGEIYGAYKKETLDVVERYENDYRMTLKEIELIEGGKIDGKVLQEEYVKNARLREQQQAARSQQAAKAAAKAPVVPAVVPAAVQTPSAKKIVPVTPATAPPVTRRRSQSVAATPQQQPAARAAHPATEVKPAAPDAAAAPHHPLTRSADRVVEVQATPVAKAQEARAEAKQDEEEKQKIAEEIEDSLIASEKEEEAEQSAKPLRTRSSEAAVQAESVLAHAKAAKAAQAQAAAAAAEPVDVDVDDDDAGAEDADAEDAGGAAESPEVAASSAERSPEVSDADQPRASTPKKEDAAEPSAPTPEPMTPPGTRSRVKRERDVEPASAEEEDEKPKTRAATRLQQKLQEEAQAPQTVSSRKRKRSEPSAAETPSKQPHTNKKFQTIALQLLTQISAHRFASTFLQPVNVHDEPEYYTLVKEPQDLRTITREIKNGTITELPHLERNLTLMFCNAIMYNEADSDVATLTAEMMRDCEELITQFKDYL